MAGQTIHPDHFPVMPVQKRSWNVAFVRSDLQDIHHFTDLHCLSHTLMCKEFAIWCSTFARSCRLLGPGFRIILT